MEGGERSTGLGRRSLIRLGAVAVAVTGAAGAMSSPASAAEAGLLAAAVTPSPEAATYSVRPTPSLRFSNPQRTTLTTFQPGHGFGQASTSSYNMNDTADYVMGTQSAYIVTNGAGGQAIISRAAALSPAMNMTGKIFAVLIKVTNTAHLTRITLVAGDTTFANNFQMQVLASAYLSNQEVAPEGRWAWVTLPWVYSLKAGSPARENITDLRIAAVDDSTGNPVKIQVQAIAAQAERPAAFPNGVVSIGFDDNWISQKTYGTSYMDKYGYPATVYSIVDLIGTPGRHTLEDLKRLEEYSGGEVAAHSWSAATHAAGFPGIPTDQLDNELTLMKGWLIDNNFQGRDLLAYPLGQFNASVIETVSRYYSFARTVNNRQQETLPPGGAYTCRAQSGTNTVTMARIIAQIDAAYDNGSWLNLLYHDITPGAASASVQITQANFQASVDYISAKGIPVRTVSQVLKAAAP